MCAIMLDTKGPEIRTGKLKGGVSSVQLEVGAEFVFHNDVNRIDAGTATVRFSSMLAVDDNVSCSHYLRTVAYVCL